MRGTRRRTRRPAAAGSLPHRFHRHRGPRLAEPRARVCFCVLLQCLAGPHAGRAQERFYLPFELSQGIVFQSGLDPYTFSAQIHPSVGFGDDPTKFFVGTSAAAVYTNPDWAFEWGGRVAVHLAKFKKKPVAAGPSVSYATCRFVAEILADEWDLGRITGGVILDIWHGALEIAPRAGYDYRQEGPLLEIALGVELIRY